MKLYVVFIFMLKILFIVLSGMILLGILPSDDNMYKLVSNFLRLTLGIFIIIFFSMNTFDNIEFHDKFFIICAGYLLIFPS